MRLEHVFTALSIGGERIDAPGAPEVLLQQYRSIERSAKKYTAPRIATFTMIVVSCMHISRTLHFFLDAGAASSPEPVRQDWLSLLKAGLELGPEAILVRET